MSLSGLCRRRFVGTEVDDFLWRAQRALHLIHRHAHLDRLRLSLLLPLALAALAALASLSLALPLALILALLLTALILLLRVIADGKQLPDRVFHVAGAGFR